MQPVMRWSFGLSVLIAFGALTVPRPAVADELTEILREKGTITKEDYIRVKAAEEKKAEEMKKRREEESPVKVGWGKKGFTLSTRDGKWKTAIQWRLQARWTYPERDDPRSAGDFSDGEESSFEIRRARMKVGGHGYQPWLKYYFEVDWQAARDFDDDPTEAGSRLLDWRIMIEKFRWLQLRIGQWKINYNRERVDSSGKQQFVERSIVNREFTIDRQIGAMLYGRVFPGTIADSWYFAGVFTGAGRGLEGNEDDQMMWMGRLQWNFLGRDLAFSQSDVEYHEKPAGSVAFAAVTNNTECTRFSSSGCGTVSSTRFPIAVDPATGKGRYRVNQMVEEVAFKWRGFSLQHEYHWKQIQDHVTGRKTGLMGSYTQVGYFWHYLFPVVPKELETAARYAFVDDDIGTPDDRRQAVAGALNWFFAGHRNKLTLDVTHLTLAQPASRALTEQRVRLQWDVSF